MLPSPNKFPHETAPLPGASSGAEVDDVLHPGDRRASRDADADMQTKTAESDRQVEVTTTAAAYGDNKRGSVEIGSCVADVSTFANAPQLAAKSTFDDDTTAESSSTPDSWRLAAAATSTRDVTCMTLSSGKVITKCIDEQNSTTSTLVKSTSEFSSLWRPALVFQRRSVAVASVETPGKVVDRLRRVVMLHPGHINSERRCLLKHSDARRYLADEDVIKLLHLLLQWRASWQRNSEHHAKLYGGGNAVKLGHKTTSC